MTQKEAIIKVLEEYEGRASLAEIYSRVIKMVTFKSGSDKKATIRSILLRNPTHFRQSKGKKGKWELTPSQREIAELKNQIVELTETNKQLIDIPKEAEFVDKFLKEVMNEYKRKRGEADPIRNILRHMGHEDAAAVLDAWIDAKEDELKKALEKLKIQIRNITMTGSNATYNENND